MAVAGGPQLTALTDAPCEPTPDGFGNRLADRFGDAAGQAGLVVRRYAIAGLTVSVEFAGPALIPMLGAALEPARVEQTASGADLTLRVFDTESTGVAVPPPPWSWDAFRPSGEIAGFTSETTRLAFQLSAGAMNVYRPHERTGWYWIPSPSRLTAHDVGAPFLFLLGWALADQGLQLVHGAGVGVEGGGVLLAGAGGAGKSSTALACVARGARYVGDDYCALEFADSPVLHRVYATAKADPATLDRLADLGADRLVPPSDTSRKAVLDLSGRHGAQIVDQLPIDALLLPEVVGGVASRLSPAGQFDALRALGPSTMVQLPGTDRDSWRLMSRLAATVPAFRLSLGTDGDGIGRTVAEAVALAAGRSS